MAFFTNKQSKTSTVDGVLEPSNGKEAILLTAPLQEKISAITGKLGSSEDVVLRKLGRQSSDEPELAIIYIDSIIDHRTINDNIVQPLQAALLTKASTNRANESDPLYSYGIAAGFVLKINSLEAALTALLCGSCLIMVDGVVDILAADASGGEQRSVEEPSTQTVMRGPQHSFTENVKTNLGLIRRIIRSSDLRIECTVIGRHTHTKIAVCYLEGIAEPVVVNEVNRRLKAIDIDGILESGYVEEFIQDKTFTPFPTLLNVERPDVVAAALLEGQVAVIIDGTPFVLLAPVTFFKFFQSAEDYYQRWDIASFLRLLRQLAFFISMLLPALYIAVTTFHQEMLPTTLLISLAAQREGIPFPALVEALLMEMTFEVLREAGVRMPRAVGPAISIVGALVLGQAAVQAGLVSPAMVIVVSFTAISNFVAPQLNIAIAARLIRFFLMLCAGVLGFFGIMTGILVLLTHLAGLQSFGVPYMTPLAPFRRSSMIDIFIRVPRWAMSLRPVAMSGGKRKKDAKMPQWQRRGKN
ncbi:spore germination protein [Paenibacillus solisilvae]|uniref:spore germination protein n=1 Tax=Paenibacillus solisilvae TaxID=2486751 RepID=UPI003A94F91C